MAAERLQGRRVTRLAAISKELGVEAWILTTENCNSKIFARLIGVIAENGTECLIFGDNVAYLWSEETRENLDPNVGVRPLTRRKSIGEKGLLASIDKVIKNYSKFVHYTRLLIKFQTSKTDKRLESYCK